MTSPSPSTPQPSRSRHGGRRPGAGAPRGNFNGFKHGGYSRRYRALIGALIDAPDRAAIMRALVEAFSQSAVPQRSPALLRPGLRLKARRHRSNQRKGRNPSL
jgi:hypothetical protein